MTKQQTDEIAAIITTSLDSTQKNAVNTDPLMSQIRALSGQEIYDQAARALIADETIPWEKKLPILDQLFQDRGQHIKDAAQVAVGVQTAQVQNVGAATTFWTENCGKLVLGGAFLLSLCFPESRKLIITSAKHLNSPGGKRALKTLNNLQGVVTRQIPDRCVTAGQTAGQSAGQAHGSSSCRQRTVRS